MISRQRVTGWILVAFSLGYLAYFARVRLFTAGPVIDRREWLYVISCAALALIGTMNLRIAASRRNRSASLPTNARSRP